MMSNARESEESLWSRSTPLDVADDGSKASKQSDASTTHNLPEMSSVTSQLAHPIRVLRMISQARTRAGEEG